jgi:hypothetical protein
MARAVDRDDPPRRARADRRRRHARLAGAVHRAVRQIPPGPPERDAARDRTRRPDAGRAAGAREPARRARARRVPRPRARASRGQRRARGAHRDPAHRRQLRGRQGHRHRRTGERPRASTPRRASRAFPARPRSPGTARPTSRPSATSTRCARATASCCTCPTRTSPTPSSAGGGRWPTDVGAASIEVGYSRLVLSACTPLFSAAKRLLVFARLTRTVPVGAARRARGRAVRPIESQLRRAHTRRRT